MKVAFLPIGKQFDIEKGHSLMEVMRKFDCGVDFVCGGNGTCGKCLVLVTKGNDRVFSAAEQRFLTEEQRARGYRLACDVKVTKDMCVLLETVKKVEKEPTTPKQKYSKEETFSVSLDLGTTTVVGAFLNGRGEQVDVITKTNPQRDYGLDVVSRLSFVLSAKENRELLHRQIVDCIDGMVRQFCLLHEVGAEQIKTMAVLGNTTMISIFLNHSMDMFTRVPFQVSFHGETYVGGQLGFGLLNKAKILVPALIGGHVGSDTLGCMVASEVYKRPGVHVIADIGTNGEIVVSRNGEIIVCSTAAGPALEGAGIKQGMCAKLGAISKVSRKENGWQISVIGNGKPIGICGSGIVDALSIFLQIGLLDKTGHLKNGKIYLDEERRVAVWQEDVRQIQLAKAAIYAGVKTLLVEGRLESKEVDTFFIAGAFGTSLSMEHAKRIGLIPVMENGCYKDLGNGSLIGGIKLLRGEVSFEEINELAAKCRHIELANSEVFTKEYIGAIDFH